MFYQIQEIKKKLIQVLKSLSHASSLTSVLLWLIVPLVALTGRCVVINLLVKGIFHLLSESNQGWW